LSTIGFPLSRVSSIMVRDSLIDNLSAETEKR
jgi:hypothetical protein